MTLLDDRPRPQARAAAPVVPGRAALLLRLLAGLVPVLLIAVPLGLVFLAGSLLGSGRTGADLAESCLPTTLGGSTASSLGTTDGTRIRLTSEQRRNAATIVAVGRRLGVPEHGLVVALATALQESTLRNLDYGDRDSLGLFQQRAAWGSAAERTDPATASTLFFQGGRGDQPGLLDIAGWQTMPVTVAAQAVQRSAFPDAYARWEIAAVQLLGGGGIGTATCATGGTEQGRAAVAAAQRWLGTPYSWGGGTLDGPSAGFGRGAGTVGFDCSSLARYAWYAGTDGEVVLPRVTTDQVAFLQPWLSATEPLRPGDLMFFHDPADPPQVYHHVGIYAGDDAMIHAPRTGAFVEMVPNVLDNAYYGSQYAGAVRPRA